MVRFPAGMRDRIAEVAKVSGRSMNAEIVSRLTASLEDAKDARTQAAMLGEIYFLLDAQREQLFEHQKKTLTEIADMVRQSGSKANVPVRGKRGK